MGVTGPRVSIASTVAIVLSVATGCTGAVDLPPVPPPAPAQREPALPAGSSDFAHRSFASPLSVRDAQEILIRTEVFAFGSMNPKRQVHAFNVILDQPDAEGRFRFVAERARPAGRLYAYCARVLLGIDERQMRVPDPRGGEIPLSVYAHDEIYSYTPAELLTVIRQRRLCDQMRRDREEVLEYFEKAR
jgi:hypothetical protein